MSALAEALVAAQAELPCAIAQTHCKRGHEFTPENTYVIPSTGSRQCLACVRAARG